MVKLANKHLFDPKSIFSKEAVAEVKAVENGDFQAVVAGHLCLDIIPEFIDTGFKKLDEIFLPGQTVNLSNVKISTLMGKTVEESIKIACAVGALCVQTFDALSGIKPMEETSAIIRRGWKNDSISLNSPYWKYNSIENVWAGEKDTKL